MVVVGQINSDPTVVNDFGGDMGADRRLQSWQGGEHDGQGRRCQGLGQADERRFSIAESLDWIMIVPDWSACNGSLCCAGA